MVAKPRLVGHNNNDQLCSWTVVVQKRSPFHLKSMNTYCTTHPVEVIGVAFMALSLFIFKGKCAFTVLVYVLEHIHRLHMTSPEQQCFFFPCKIVFIIILNA